MDPLLTVKQVMAKLAIGRAGFYKLVKQGDIKVIRIGGSVRVSPDEVDRFIRDKTQEWN